MIFSYGDAFINNQIITFPDYAFGNVALQPSQILESSVIQGSPSNSVTIIGTTNQNIQY